MKKILAVILVVGIVILGAIIAFFTVKDDEEMQKVNLYVRAMRSAFEAENGGNEFIAIKLDTLEGLSSVGKKIVLKEFDDLSPNVYDFEDIKGDKSKFEFEGEDPSRAINGSVLWIDLEEYKDSSYKIKATSWFGNLGSVTIEYDVNFIDGAWRLTEVSRSIS